MTDTTTGPVFGAGLWNFATYVDRYATDGYGEPRTTLEQIDLAGQVEDISYVDINYPWTKGVTTADVAAALECNGLKAIGVTPDIYLREHQLGAFTNPDPAKRASAMRIMQGAADAVRELGARYVKIWPGQDGFDYPFQVDYAELDRLAVEGMRDLAQANPDLKFVIEYKPREPRTHMFWSSAAKTVLGIQRMGVDNVGVLLDFGHALFGGESPAEAAQLLIDHGLLWGMDVNDNYRGWDDDMVVGTVHITEVFEFFHVLRKNGWEGVWQLDQFPFREDVVDNATTSIRFLKALYRALERLDEDALAEAQRRQDPLAAQRVVQDALLSCMA
ncbi:MULTISPECIES: TIM barrel protein [unclassified Actinomyces]|uniref:TIM barrel protein n=1 Tax=unclassified Actinomyces TaxID=2609248 RepID=UPI002016C721|nr:MULTISPECIES: TIM barrel protein [unclassified Actinomyces]MCL3777322.1 TIM barrel protein [Actinomyces sp. AC-20-1]MCL3789654.1 TIM barrel protein [Actinomyces sp. 187325]MCL3792181.1 TIM barrel protein [Actinomyces sp. 186855]MCL3794813.1 TIM barrel protein [Actinomyces sp. 217892]